MKYLRICLIHCHFVLNEGEQFLIWRGVASSVHLTRPDHHRAGADNRFKEAQRWEYHSLTSFTSDTMVTRLATAADSYPVADVHVAAFYPRSILAPFLRLDRILSLMIGDLENKKSKDGRCFVCLVADARPGWRKLGKSQQSSQTELSEPLTGISTDPFNGIAKSFLSIFNLKPMAEAWGVPYQQRGILGSIVYDTLGYHIPAQWLPEGRWQRRRNVGYISNLAIAPGARRQGIASKLVARCEAIARSDPEVEAVALHVNRCNGAGRRLYEACGYQVIDEKSQWKQLLGLNRTAESDMLLLIKHIRTTKDPADTKAQK